MESDKFKRPNPEEPEQLACEICLTEIPKNLGHSAEGEEYVHHFCGIECLEKWRAKHAAEAHQGNPDEAGATRSR